MPLPGDLNGWKPWTDTLDDVTRHPIQLSDPHHVRHGGRRSGNLMNFVPSYILGVIGIFALHPTAIGVAVVKIAAPSAIGALGVWLARLPLARFASPGPDSVRAKSGPA
jgi:hypothetical protein